VVNLFIVCPVGSLNLYADKVTLSMAAFLHTKPAYAGTACGICGAQDCDDRNVLHSYSHVGYAEFSDIEEGYT